MAKKSTRTIRDFTPDERKRWKQAKDEEQSAMADNIAAVHARDKAIAENRSAAVADVISQLSSLKESQGLSYADLASRTGTDRSSLARLFNTGTNPTLQTIESLFNAMGYRLEISAVPIDRVTE